MRNTAILTRDLDMPTERRSMLQRDRETVLVPQQLGEFGNERHAIFSSLHRAQAIDQSLSNPAPLLEDELECGQELLERAGEGEGFVGGGGLEGCGGRNDLVYLALGPWVQRSTKAMYLAFVQKAQALELALREAHRPRSMRLQRWH